MNRQKIGIARNLKMWNHQAANSAIDGCVKYCQENNIEYQFVDPYSNDALEQMCSCGAVVWFVQNYLYADLLQAANILRAVEDKGVKVFPSSSTIWHFDDKVAQKYAFESVGAPSPKSYVFYDKDNAIEFIKQTNLPIVAKLRNGSGASNVKLIRTIPQGESYIKRMFAKGFDPSPSLLYKAYSKAQSSKSFKTLISRIRKIPMFLATRGNAKLMPYERGYCYFQEYIKNDGFDIKVVVIAGKLSYFVRNVRKGDFRASGGGDFFYQKSYITPDIIESAFKCADDLNLQCIGFDYVVDKSTGKGLIIEMCYGFDFDAVQAAGGYFDRQGQWHDEPLVITDEIIKLLTTQP